jgi:GMP synthase-like glutamine amidotransferase
MMPIKIHIFQHVSFEGPAMIAEWAKSKGHVLSYTRFYENPELPELNSIDWLAVMGGPMNVYDYDQYPWLKEEAEFIKKAVRAAKVVLGICLGAQLIAKALGSKVYEGGKKEIGWFPVFFSPESGKLSEIEFLANEAMVFHWHGDTFDIPEGAVKIASSEAFPNQAFLYNKKVLALQFHCEMNEQAISAMIENCGDEIVIADYVQSRQEIVEKSGFLGESNALLMSILGYLEDLRI